MLKKLLILLLFLPLAGMAADLKPWYPKALEIQPQAAYLFQYYDRINSKQGNVSRPSNNHFLTLSLGGDYDVWSVELETTLAATRHRPFGFCDFRLTGRYQWMDDVVGDPLSVVLGATYIQDCRRSLHDLSCFYHGQIEGEFHLAAGKEWSCEQFWSTHLWGILGLGIADVGSPWLRGDLAWEHNWFDLHRIGFEMQSLWGLGGKNLNLDHHFHGYGLIAHYSIDLGLYYQYQFECAGILSAGYRYRVYARNCPRNVNSLTISYLYPLGL